MASLFFFIYLKITNCNLGMITTCKWHITQFFLSYFLCSAIKCNFVILGNWYHFWAQMILYFCNVIKVLAEDNMYFLSYSFFVVARFALSNFINTDIATIFHVNMYLVFLVVVLNCNLPEHYCFPFNHVQKVTFYASRKIVHLVEFKR